MLKFLPSYCLAILLAFSTSSAFAYQSADCPVDPNWLKNPSLPVEVKKSGEDGTSNFCDFYQFSTQTFLYLLSPANSDVKDNTRKFQVSSDFPLLESDNNAPANSCDGSVTGSTLRTSLDKSSLSTGQAGGGATLYDQNGNIVYYDVRFNRELCDLTASAVEMQKRNIINFPSGTMELKFAWKQLSTSEIQSNRFVTQHQRIDNKVVTLGLVGMHIMRATKDHPEFVWATYEHKYNSPDCSPSGTISGKNWLFSDAACAAGLPGTVEDKKCNFNKPKDKQTSVTGTPTNICRVYPYGTGQGDLKADENLAAIHQQNSELVALVLKDPRMKVLSNYFTVGGLWVSDITKSSGGNGVPNERGSLRLANTVAETTYQKVQIHFDKDKYKDKKTFSSNCFGCHNYNGTQETPSNNITSQSLSHIFQDIKTGSGEDVDVTASQTIFSNSAAGEICPNTCNDSAEYLKWNGDWTNTNSSAGSVCGCTKK